MKLYFPLVVVLAFTLSSCAPTVNVSRLKERPALSADENVTVFYLSKQIPAEAEIIGVVNIDDNGFTANCSYDAVVAAASDQARAMGANTLNIAEHKYPDAVNSCHRITAFAYYISPEVMAAMESDDKTRINADDIRPIDLADIEGKYLTDSTENATPEQPGYSIAPGRYQISEKTPKYAPNYSLSKCQSLGQRIRVGLDVGYSYRLGKLKDVLSESMVDRKGFYYGLDVIFFNRGTFGWGPKYVGRIYDNKFNNYLGSGNLRVNVDYFGLAFMRRTFDRNHKNALILSFSGGCIYYTEKLMKDNTPPIVYDKVGVGATCEFGYDIRIGRSNFLGLKLGVSYGAVATAMEEMINNVSSIDLTGGIRF